MQCFTRLVTVVLLSALLASTSFAAEPLVPAEAPAGDQSPLGKITETLTAVTGIAISPLLGTGAYGLYQYYFKAKTAEERAALPWYAKPKFFFTALLLVAACAAKDAFGAFVPPGLKKPMDVLETVENKVSGLVAAGAIVPITMSSVSSWVAASAAAGGGVPVDSGLAMIQMAAVDFTWLLNLISIPFNLAVFAVVWMASHAITVLILLSPWGAIDAVLKAARTSVLGVLTVTAQMDPRVSAVLSLVIIVIAYFVSGWAFRLTVFGSVFCWDFLTRAKRRFVPRPSGNWAFTGGRLSKVPVRTFGRLVPGASAGQTEFVYRPWMILAERRTSVTLTSPCIGKGLFFSSVRQGDATFFLLPPRCRTHEEQLVQIYQLSGGVQDAGLRRAWSAMRELFTSSKALPSPEAAQA